MCSWWFVKISLSKVGINQFAKNLSLKNNQLYSNHIKCVSYTYDKQKHIWYKTVVWQDQCMIQTYIHVGNTS